MQQRINPVVDANRHRGTLFNHHVRNPGRVPLFFVTVYAPPEY